MRPVLILAVSLGLYGCAGGCGEPEPEPSSQSSGGGGGGSPTQGSGTVAIEAEREAKRAHQQAQQAAAGGKGITDESREYAAAGKPVDAPKPKAPPTPRLVAACRSHDPGCDDLRAALKTAKAAWGAKVLVEQRPSAGPSLTLFAGGSEVSRRSGLPFARDEALESVEDYRGKLADWLISAVPALDLNAAPPAKPAGRGS